MNRKLNWLNSFFISAHSISSRCGTLPTLFLLAFIAVVPFRFSSGQIVDLSVRPVQGSSLDAGATSAAANMNPPLLIRVRPTKPVPEDLFIQVVLAYKSSAMKKYVVGESFNFKVPSAVGSEIFLAPEAIRARLDVKLADKMNNPDGQWLQVTKVSAVPLGVKMEWIVRLVRGGKVHKEQLSNTSLRSNFGPGELELAIENAGVRDLATQLEAKNASGQ